MKTLAVAASLLVAAGALAQVSETVNVEVIQVPVYVTGPDGNPIRSLTKENFALFVNGGQKPIDYFDPVDITARVKSDEPRPERERRLYLLLFDLSCAADECRGLAGRIARAQKAAGAAVERSTLDSDLFAVATYTSTRGLRLATPFLRDRVAIRRAVSTLAITRSGDPLGLTVSSTAPTQWLSDRPVDNTDAAQAAINASYDFAATEIASSLMGGIALQDAQREPAKRIIEDQFDDFGDLATRLGTLEGQKHIVLFSQGFDSQLVHGGGQTSPDSPVGLDARAMDKLESMLERFRTAGVFLDAVDIYGLRIEQGPFVNDALQTMAHGTGGEFVKNRNDFARAVNDLTRRQEVVYLLGFDRRRYVDGKIEVRVSGVPRGTRVSYRQGFGMPDENRGLDPLRLADIIVNDLPQTGITMGIEGHPPFIYVGLQKGDIIPQLVEAEPWVETILYVFDSSGTALVSRQKRIVFDGAMREGQEPIIIRQQVDLPPGKYVVKAIARIGGSSSVGFTKANLTVN